MAIGNGFVNNEELEYNTLLRYAYFHGIVDEEMWNTIKYRCCDGCTDSCDITEVQELVLTLRLRLYQLFQRHDSNQGCAFNE